MQLSLAQPFDVFVALDDGIDDASASNQFKSSG